MAEKMRHLSEEERVRIEQMLNTGCSLSEIARELKRNCSTISREVRRHVEYRKIGCKGKAFNDCRNQLGCGYQHLCQRLACEKKYCCFCSQCYLYCVDYEKTDCPKLERPPYVCNFCGKRAGCSMEKHIYSSKYAQKEYEKIRSESRSGVNMTKEELSQLDEFLSPLIKQRQSIHHIMANNPDKISCSLRTIYNYIDAGVLTARNIDLPRKVRFRAHQKTGKIRCRDRSFRIGRTYRDFTNYIEKNPGSPVVQIDSVEGTKGGKVLLTIHFVSSEFMLAYIRDENTSKSVTKIFDDLYRKLQPEIFRMLFPVLLTDNGCEFTDPRSLELDNYGKVRTKVFYCNAYAPYQKGAVENNHEFIRRIVPKGKSFDRFEQKDIDVMMNHINSYRRVALGDKSPYEIFQFFYGKGILDLLGAKYVDANDIILRPRLLSSTSDK